MGLGLVRLVWLVGMFGSILFGGFLEAVGLVYVLFWVLLMFVCLVFHVIIYLAFVYIVCVISVNI
jgi:hypothetical protein